MNESLTLLTIRYKGLKLAKSAYFPSISFRYKKGEIKKTI